ncbi:MAG: DUF4142 domain-containing protein [Oligoflexales bacterium]
MSARKSFIVSAAVALLGGSAVSYGQGKGPSDAQIAGIVVTANAVDVEAGKIGEKSKNPEVQKFAKQMVIDHTAVNKQASELASKLKLTPADSDVSKSLKDGGKKNADHLKSLKGTEFDKAYVTNEVAYHQAVLNAIDSTLIPNAKNTELKALLEKVRPAFVAHLDHAKRIESSLASSK